MKKFRDFSLSERIENLSSKYSLDKDTLLLKSCFNQSESMIENCIGLNFIPSGVLIDLKVNEKKYDFIPLCTEEPSVVAACNFANKVVKNIESKVLSWISLGHIYYLFDEKDMQTILEKEDLIVNYIKENTKNMQERGGGFLNIKAINLENKYFSLELSFDTVDSLGANFINSILEKTRAFINKELGIDAIFCILSNDYSNRICHASFEIEVKSLDLFLKKNQSDISDLDYAKKIIHISDISSLDSSRAVTNNKGIMNGMTAIAIAFANDTRAIESSIHYYASKDSKYKSLSNFYLNNNILKGELTVPSPYSIVGGSTSKNKISQEYLKMTGISSAKELAQIATAVGLLQNFSAIKSLALEGIQKGHMTLHNKNILY